MDAKYRLLSKNGLPKLLDDYRTMANSSLRGPDAVSSQRLDGNFESSQNVKVKRRELDSSLRSTEVNKNYNINTPKRQMLLSYHSGVKSRTFSMKESMASTLVQTILNGEKIPCFEIGGEKRLCLIAIFKKVLNAFGEDDLAAASACLKLYVSTCTATQLATLKKAGVLQDHVQNCGLITQTDAERLVNKLMNLGVASPWSDPPSADSFKVYHDCFGDCTGLFDPELYKSEDALCVRCLECQRLFSPSTFVCHSHSTRDDRITHWGFDRKNWRHYLLLSPEQDDSMKVPKQLKEMKAKFDPLAKKRKHVSSASDVIN